MHFRGYCWSPSVIPNYVPTRIFLVCRRNWKGQRTESRSSAAISTARCKTTMWRCAVSQQIWWLACLAFRRNRFSPRKQAQNGRRRSSSILAHRLLSHLRRRRRRKKSAHGREHSGERTPLACWFRRSAETIFHLARILEG